MNKAPPLFNHTREVSRTRLLLERLGSPRLHMSLIVALTAAVGFLASSLLLRSGMHTMALRYPLALLVAYGAFLGLLGAWVHFGGHYQSIHPEPLDVLDGASTIIDASQVLNADAAGAAGESAWAAAAALADGEGLLLGLAIGAIVALVLAMGAAFFVVADAPVLMAELLVDAAIARGLFKRVRAIDTQSHWLRSAFLGTVWRFVAVVSVFAIAGALIQHYVPGAVSLGDAMGRIARH